MSTINDGGAAYPLQICDRHGKPCEPQFGMTLRDAFAMNAPISLEVAADKYKQNHGLGNMGDVLDYLADMRYAYADAMLRARETSHAD